MKYQTKILSLFLAVIMMITFTVPAYAAVSDSPFDLAEAWEVSDSGMAEEETPADNGGSPGDIETRREEPSVAAASEQPGALPDDSPDSSTDDAEAPGAAPGTLGMSGDLSGAEILALMEQRLNNLRLAGQGGLTLRAMSGDTGSVTHTTIPINSYNVTVPGVGSAYGSVMYRMKINGQDAFCTQIWRMVGSGTYTAGNATAGNSATAQYIANYMASPRTDADYVAAQVLVWESLYGDIGLYSQIIAGTSYQSNYTALKNGSESGSGLIFWISGPADQEIVTPATVEVPPDDKTPPDDKIPPDDKVPPTETVTTTSTRSEIRTDTTYEYSDAIGQITIAKRDNEARSLDGAVFNIKIQFANGQTGGDSAFEVHNGSRLFTWTHPCDDHEPATVTVTEVRAPDGYIANPAPQTAIVHPTHTRVTKVTTTTITITTTTTTTTNIETGEVLAKVSSDAETSLDPPIVREYTDFIEGDRETTLTFVNQTKPCSLIIYKYKYGDKSAALQGARFRIRYADPDVSAQVWTLTTDSGGTIKIDLPYSGTLIVEELEAPPNHVLPTPAIWEVTVDKGENKRIDISNDRKPGLTITKIDEATGERLSGAVLRVTKQGALEYQDVTTGTDGTATLTGLAPGWVTVEEIKAPNHYILDQTPHHIQLRPNENAALTIKNRHKPSLKIVKLDSVTKQPLQYVTFSAAYKNGVTLGEFTTDENGEIYLENIDPGLLVITETKGRDGYIIADKEKEALVEWGKLTTVEFLNTPKNPLLIKKIDSKTGEPLSGAVFSVTKVGGEYVGEYTTGRNGFITVTGIDPGYYTVRETKSPLGYILNDVPKTVELKLNQPAEVTFENKPLNGIQIHKIDAQTREPLEGVKFVVREKGGRTVGEFTTNANGLIDVPDLEPGWYQVYESAALDGYLLEGNVRDVELAWNDHKLLEFTNTKLSGLQVRKLDSVTGEPLQGVKFRLTRMNGEYVGDYVTNAGGYFAVSGLEPDWYTAYETATIAGYVLDTTPQNVQIKKGALAVLEFTNKPLSGMQIKKVDSVTREPLAGVEFKVTELDGRLVGNYTTDDAGLVFVPNLTAGWYVITEVKGLTGYKPDTAPRNVEVKTGELNVVEYKNQPYPVLIIKKIDADTLQPLEGVRFRLLDRYQREIGIFTTNALGQIVLTGMDEGAYSCQETEAKAGYVLDATVREVSLQWGKTTTVEVKNTPMATLRIKKVDSITGKPLPGVTFLLYDWKNNLLGEYITDNNGIIELPKAIAAGKYKLKETRTDPGYVLDEQVRTIEVKAGETTEIVIENEPRRGRIQIVKKSADDNPVTRDKAGKLLEGAVFEVYDKDLNVVDTITTDSRGVATTGDLPLGAYAIKEVKAPSGYFTEGKVFYAEVKLHGDLIRFEVLNNSMDISVTVEKRGNVEVIAGDEMKYDFSGVANTSNVELEKFFWHDRLPADAVRLKTIYTGTWNEKLTYSVTYKTNLKSAYTTLAANLSSSTSHTLDCSPAALRLASNEYITDIRFEFGTVKAGFRESEAPSFVVTTLATLPDGHRIVNHTDVGGRSGSAEVTAKDIWVTVALGKPKGCLPKTGHSMSSGW